MEIFNIGPLELILFLVIAFLLLGPKGMVLTAYKIGQWIREAIRSPMWREILRSAQEIRELPTKIIEETGLPEEIKSIREETNTALNEVNASIREAQQEVNASVIDAQNDVKASVEETKEAARLPEAENVILPIHPVEEAVPASNGKTYPPPVYSEPAAQAQEQKDSAKPSGVVETASVSDIPVSEGNQAASEVTTVDVEPEPPSAPVLSVTQPENQGLPVDAATPVSLPSENTELSTGKTAQPTRKLRKKTVDTVSAAPVDPGVNTGENGTVEVVDVSKPARKSRKKVVPAQGVEGASLSTDLSTSDSSPLETTSFLAAPAGVNGGENGAALVVEEQKPPKKRASRKKDPEAGTQGNS